MQGICSPEISYLAGISTKVASSYLVIQKAADSTWSCLYNFTMMMNYDDDDDDDVDVDDVSDEEDDDDMKGC